MIAEEEIAIMNARAQEDAAGYGRDQRLIAMLRSRMAGEWNELIVKIIGLATCECSPAAPVECSVCQFTSEISKLKRPS